MMKMITKLESPRQASLSKGDALINIISAFDRQAPCSAVDNILSASYGHELELDKVQERCILTRTFL